MQSSEATRHSKFLSLVLRHKPDAAGVILDSNGWVNVSELLSALSKKRRFLSMVNLKQIVANCPKQRFIFNEDRTKIRANQGHSLDNVDLQLKPQNPPEFLFHGTVPHFLDSIRATGLSKMSRHHVHLSQELETATKVGQRRGKPCILRVRSGEMAKESFEFFRSENGVWLTDNVPPRFIEFPE